MKKKSHFFAILMTLLIFSFPVSIRAEKTTEKNESTVILGGDPFGIKMFSDGVLVIKTEPVKSDNGLCCPAADAGIKANDIVVTANGKHLKSNEELSEIIENSGGTETELKIKREEKYINVTLCPVKDSQGIYRAGMWIKDSAAGIGTVTFYSEETGGFCGLGHGICDTDTGGLIPLSTGDVDNAYIASVTKSTDGDVGTLNGYFTSEEIGNAVKNCKEGIYGELETENISGTEIEIARKEEIKTGAAYVYTTTYGQTPQAYEAEIIKIYPDDETVNMIIKITDKDLLSATGGIVQGMSGSPIVQNGKLAGAITHVIVDDVDCGYAIFAETMMETLEETCN